MSKLLANNEHRVDRILRVAGGLALLALAFVGPKTPLGYFGLVLVATGLVGSCPVYTALGLSTNRPRKH